MVTAERTVTISRPAGEAISYLADFANTTEWDPGTDSCDRTARGPLAVGATRL